MTLRALPREALYGAGDVRELPEPQTDEPRRARRRSSDPSTRRLTDHDVACIKALLLASVTHGEICDKANLAPALLAAIASGRRGAAVSPQRSGATARRWLERVEREQDPRPAVRAYAPDRNAVKVGPRGSVLRYGDGALAGGVGIVRLEGAHDSRHDPLIGTPVEYGDVRLPGGRLGGDPGRRRLGAHREDAAPATDEDRTSAA